VANLFADHIYLYESLRRLWLNVSNALVRLDLSNALPVRVRVITLRSKRMEKGGRIQQSAQVAKEKDLSIKNSKAERG